MSRIGNAFSSFFGILFGGELPPEVAKAYGYIKASEVKKPEPVKPAPKVPEVKPADGALQLLGILQREARLVDFLMEDIGAYSDDQVGAAVRSLHEQCGATLKRCVTLNPIIDGVEGTYTKAEAAGADAKQGLKFIGNVPAEGRAPGGILRHKGWKASNVDLPKVSNSVNLSLIAPAEIEVE
ncbi:MAG TPA: DUF2760 domain-containing protein [Bryobacteraceae bacterium]|nr:DUF2760 domain-containing protein [Bryobacteraceae bacterium]